MITVFNTIVLTFRDWVRLIEMRPCGWQAAFPIVLLLRRPLSAQSCSTFDCFRPPQLWCALVFLSFYRAQHRQCHGISRLTQAFCAIRLPCCDKQSRKQPVSTPCSSLSLFGRRFYADQFGLHLITTINVLCLSETCFVTKNTGTCSQIHKFTCVTYSGTRRTLTLILGQDVH
jgi:hypothetical protein